jgi:membrane-associated phospholipid phosphatase
VAPGRTWQWIGLAGGSTLLLALLADQLLHGPLTGLDHATLDAVTPWAKRFPLHAIGEVLSWPGSVPGAISITAVTAIVWFLRGARREAAWVLAGGIAASIAVTLVKLAVHRQSPPLGIAVGASFPSGHTVGAAANLGLLILLEAQVLVDRHGWTGTQQARAWRWAVAAWLLAGLGTALARLLAQAHWLTDVLAALGLGLAVVCATLLAAKVPRSTHALTDLLAHPAERARV